MDADKEAAAPPPKENLRQSAFICGFIPTG
jgi:hypothetical protein